MARDLMELLAISDLHLAYPVNREAFANLLPRPNDWLILAGDIGETRDHMEFALGIAKARYAEVFWVPGNHELWTTPKDGPSRGVEKYLRMVEVCRSMGVHTPEDPWLVWPGDGRTVIAPLFTLYDYSFGPDGMSVEQVVAWAAEENIRCTDEYYLHSDPFPSREAWCEERVRLTEARLDATLPHQRLVLIDHFPLRRDLVRLFRIPRFIPWCGTRRTEDWHTRYPVDVVVSGHLHMRATDYRDGVRFEEVALGYPRHWQQAKGLEHYLRRILPHPVDDPHQRPARAGPTWHR